MGKPAGVQAIQKSESKDMNAEILMVAEAVSAEKGVSEDIIFEAIELALATATKKRYDEEADILVCLLYTSPSPRD